MNSRERSLHALWLARLFAPVNPLARRRRTGVEAA